MKDVVGFTINPFIFIKEESLRNNKVLITHESIHILQQKELGLFKFFILYFYYYLRNIFRYKDITQAYYFIPFEIEAYLSENNENNLNNRKFHWSNYAS